MQVVNCCICGRPLAQLDPPTSGALFAVRKMLAGFGMDADSLPLDPVTLAKEFNVRCVEECR